MSFPQTGDQAEEGELGLPERGWIPAAHICSGSGRLGCTEAYEQISTDQHRSRARKEYT